jgi:hypothetical protein
VYGVPFVDLLFRVIKKQGEMAMESHNDIDFLLSLKLLLGIIENHRG